MATKSKPETAQSTKPKKAMTSTSTSPATEVKRTAGAVTRSSSSVGKTPGAAVSNVPSYLRSTQSSRTESPKSGGRKETPATKPTPALTRGQSQSSEKPSQPAQLQRVLFSAGPRSPTLKSPSSASSSPRIAAVRPTELSKSLSSSSSRSRTATARPAELGKSKTMPKPGASARPVSASGSLSRLGSTTGKTVKKSPVSGPSTSKRQAISDSIKQHVTVEEQSKPQVVVEEEEKATPPPPAPPPAAVTVENESVEPDVIVMEEDHVVEDEHQQEEEEVEVEVSTVKEEEEEEVHTEEAAIIPDISPPYIIETSEDPAVEEEEEEDEEEVKIEEEGNDHEIEFHQEHQESHIDEGEIIYSELGDKENPNKETLIELQPPQVDEAEQVVKSDVSAVAEEENPNKETLNPVDEEKVHNDVTVEAAASSSVSQKPAIQPEPAKLEVIRRSAAMINSQRSSVKETPAAYNDVIEETKNKLMEKRKNKVRALVGAFETVISLQE